MCARYDSSVEVDEVHQALGFDVSPAARAWTGTADTRPTNPVLIGFRTGGMAMLGVGKWGWNKQELHINAKSETADTVWAEGANHRCVMPARAWYEWQKRPAWKKDGTLRKMPIKVKHRISTASPVFFLLAIWRSRNEVAEVSMLTRAAPPDLFPVHDRAVLPVNAETARAWVDSVTPIREWGLSPLILPATAVPV